MSDRPSVAALVDWGTTAFRLWLIARDGTVLAERRGEEGMLTAQSQGFASILHRHLAETAAPEGLPVVICGMAGSRQGWIEVPYAQAPAALDAILAGAVQVPGEARTIRIVPGVAQSDPSAPDVMRGEETKLAGVPDLRLGGRHVVCMPGTHSKWAEVRDGTLVSFRTWMTGELFSVLSRHSILRYAIGEAPTGASESDAAFQNWCEEGLAHPAETGALFFRIRASSLLQDLSPDHASAALSGLLIGTEIAAARRQFEARDNELLLVASGRMASLYGRALSFAGIATRVIDADVAVRAGLTQAARAIGMIEGSR